MNKAILLNLFQVGVLVELKAEFLNEPVGTIAYVYEHYTIGQEQGISLITQNGVVLGGFSVGEQHQYLKYFRDTGMVYNFRSVSYLTDDWRKGVFQPMFDQIKLGRYVCEKDKTKGELS